MGRYAKFWTAAIGLVVVVAGHYVGVNNWLFNAITAALVAAGVYQVPNA